MKKEVTDINRLELYKHYEQYENPFLILTARIDITNIYQHYHKYYPSIGYYIALSANKIANFKYRYENNKIFYYDEIRVSFTEKLNDNINFFSCSFKENYEEFLNEYNEQREKFLKNSNPEINYSENEIWLSCVPWFNFNSLVPPFNKKVTIPQFIWDKFIFENNHCYINLMIMVHHGLVDGYHINLFLEELQKSINKIGDKNV